MRLPWLPVIPALLAGFALIGASSGCAMFSPSCAQFAKELETTNYATQYRLEDRNTGSSLARGQLAAVPAYALRLDTDRTRTCTHVRIDKELVLLRRAGGNLIFEETREFFTASGKRVAVKTETLDRQLTQSGRYRASVPLPIPREAVAGRYRLATTLSVRTPGGKATALAYASAFFEVVADR